MGWDYRFCARTPHQNRGCSERAVLMGWNYRILYARPIRTGAVGLPVMAEPPMFPPPPSGPPPPQTGPPYANPPPWTPPGQPWGYPTGPPPGPYGYARTEPLAIVSLVAALAAGFLCFIGPIVAIVFGHIARSRIKRSRENGSGMALAGLILGYVEVAIGVAAVVVLIAVAVNTNDDATGSAQRLARQIDIVANRTNSSPRDGDVVRRAIREAGFADDRVLVGSTGEYAVTATNAELAGEGWRLEVRRGFSGRACLYLPQSTTDVADITGGYCPSVNFSG